MDPAFLPPCVTQLNGLSMVRARRYSACRSRHENWKKRGILGLIFLAFSDSKVKMMELTAKWKSPQFPNWTEKSIGETASPGLTALRQFGSWLCPLTYITPWKFGSTMDTETVTPSAKQLTSMSGLGKSVLGGGGIGIGAAIK